MSYHKESKMKQTSNRPFLIAITGGIASGKSVAANWFKKKNITVISTDDLGHKVLKLPRVKADLVKKFGNGILAGECISRQELAEVVFSKSEYLQYLNSIVHPEIRKMMQEVIDSSIEEILIFEIPLLFEGSLDKSFDLVINISVSKTCQMKRLLAREMTEAEAEQRITAQLPDWSRKERADINIDNNFTLDRLYEQLSKILQYLDKFERKEIVRIIPDKWS